MVFPATALPVRAQLFIAGQWVDFSDSSLIRDPIRFRRGVPDEGVRPDPSICNLSLKNRTGDLSPRKPTGQYYGLFGRNTALRIVIDEADDDFNRTSSNGWGTSSSGHTWATSGGLASAYAVSGGSATIAISAVNSARITALNVSLADCDVVATYKPGVVATGAAIQMGTMLRYQDDNNLYQVVLLFNTDSTVQTAIIKRVAGTNTTIGFASLGTYNASSQWRMRAKICGRVLTVRAWDAVNGSEPSTFDTWAVDNASNAILTAGKIGTRMLLQTGNTNALNVTVTTSNLEVVHHRYNGEVPVWPVDWDLSGNDVWSPITAAGLLRRINKNGEEFSALRRTLKSKRFINDFTGTSSNRLPRAYWPLEEETGSTVASSGLPNGTPMRIAGTVDWGSVSTVVGSDALPDTMSGSAALTGSVPPPSALTGAWTVAAIFTPPTLTSNWSALTWKVTGAAFLSFELRLTTGGNLELYGANGSTSTLLASGTFRDLASRPTVVMVKAQTSGADTTYVIVTTDTEYTVEFETAAYTAAGSTPGYPTEVTVTSVAGGASDTAGIGHVTVWDGYFFLLSDVAGTDLVAGIQGNNGDQAITRLFRLLDRQEEIPFIYIPGSLDGLVDAESQPLGPQRSGRISEVIDDAIVVDKGLFFEARDENAVIYMARIARYNQTTALALTYGSSGHVAPPFRPVEDDRDVVNDLTIVREGGASGRYEKRDGALSVDPPPDGVYRNPRKKTLPLYSDEQPYQHAAWEVNVATWDEARYPAVNVNMARSARDAATVYEQAKRLDIGGRLTIASPPAWLPPDTVDLHALGLTEQIGGGQRIGAHAWSISAQTVPAGPYTVGVYGSSRYDSANSTLASAINTVATSPLVVTEAGHALWLTGSGFSFDLAIGGERITVTAISSAVLDAFGRTVSNGWGTADTGGAWTTSGGTAANYAVSGGKGTITLPTGDTNARTVLLPTSYGLTDMRATISSSQVATGANINGQVRFRSVDASNYYVLSCAFDTTGNVDVSINRVLAGAATTLVTSSNAVAYSAGSDVFTRVQAVGSTLRAKVWVGSTEPTGWTVETTDANHASGQVGVRATLSGGNTNVNPVVSFDSYEVFDPQTFTVTRSVNGVVKSHSAGVPVRLWSPGRYAL